MQPANPLARLSALWRGKALARVAFLLVVSAVVAGLAAAFGIARDYGYLHASILTGSPGGQYHALATRLSEQARREHGTLTVIPTAGSIENVSRLASALGCSDMFALIQDGTPVPSEARLELLGRLPTPEVPAAARPHRPRLSRPSGFARGVHRDRPTRLRNRISHAAAVRGRGPSGTGYPPVQP